MMDQQHHHYQQTQLEATVSDIGGMSDFTDID